MILPVNVINPFDKTAIHPPWKISPPLPHLHRNKMLFWLGILKFGFRLSNVVGPVLLDEPRETGSRLVLSQVFNGFYDCVEVFLLHITKVELPFINITQITCCSSTSTSTLYWVILVLQIFT